MNNEGTNNSVDTNKKDLKSITMQALENLEDTISMPKIKTENEEEAIVDNSAEEVSNEDIDAPEQIIVDDNTTSEEDNTVVVDSEVKEENKAEEVINEVKEKHGIIETLKDMCEYVRTRNSSELFQLVWRLILIAVFIIAFKVPFALLDELGKNVMISLGISFTDKFLNIYESVWNILYCVIALIAFFKIISDRYYKLVKQIEKSKEIK